MGGLIGDASDQAEEGIAVVLGIAAVAPQEATLRALMNQHDFTALLLDCDRLHHPTAARSSVAGIDIDMARPEAARAVIRIPVPTDFGAAVLALKVFHVATEAFGHGDGILPGRIRERPRCAIESTPVYMEVPLLSVLVCPHLMGASFPSCP